MPLLSISASADDALVLPEGVFRFTAGSSFVKSTQMYDENRNKVNPGAALGAKVKLLGDQLNLGSGGVFPGASWSGLNPSMSVESSVTREDIALEYGIHDRVSLSLQLPMYLSGAIKMSPNQDLTTALTTLNATGAPTAGSGKIGELLQKLSRDGKKAGTFGDLLLGAKYQFLRTGATGYSTEPGTYRAAAALGVKLPTGKISTPDSNDLSTTTADDTQAWIIGARTYWDYQFTSFFYLDFYTEHEYRLAGARNYLATDDSMAYKVIETKFRPGFYNHLELDFTLTPEIVKGLKSESGVKLMGDFTSQGEYTQAPAGYASIVGEKENASRDTVISPYIGIFYTGAPFPVKLKTVYYQPTGGMNSFAVSGISVIAQAYLKF